VSVKELVFWTFPVGIALFAGYLGLRAYHDKPWIEPPRTAPMPAQCPEGVYRCRDREVQLSTGEIGPDGKMCMFHRVGGCQRACASTHVTLSGVEQETAHRQLCDAPRKLDSLVLEERSFLGAPARDAEVCEGDGYIPTLDGFNQCVLKSGNDPSASGVVTGRVTCRFGAVPTSNHTPMLIKREEAIAVWCKRDPLWSPDADVVDEEEDAATDAAIDAAQDAKADAPHDVKAD
jgi:hypothetical protein